MKNTFIRIYKILEKRKKNMLFVLNIRLLLLTKSCVLNSSSFNRILGKLKLHTLQVCCKVTLCDVL